MDDRRSEWANDPTRTAIEGPRLTRARAATRTSAEAFVRPAITEGSVLAGRYQVEQRLGQGGMGAVYRVRDTIHPDRPTALKILGAARPDREALRRFRAEFGLLAQLTHPNLTPVYDFDTQDETGLCFFTMEHVDGVDLESAIGGAGWRDVLVPIVAVCRALAFIHSRRIIHFDVKPSNIMVTADGTAKLLDFGIAELVQAVGGLDLCGTPGFIAPELLQGSPAVDRRADLYSLGITLYRLLYGRMPGASATPGLQSDSGRGVDLAVDDRVPSWLNAIVLRLTDPSPAARFSGANAFIDAINAGSGLQFALQTDETRQSYVLSSAFVGRGTELDRLRSFVRRRVVEKAVDFGGICVVGDAGAGKSRILRELRHRVQFAGIAFVECDCYETDEAELGPLGEALRQLVVPSGRRRCGRPAAGVRPRSRTCGPVDRSRSQVAHGTTGTFAGRRARAASEPMCRIPRRRGRSRALRVFGRRSSVGQAGAARSAPSARGRALVDTRPDCIRRRRARGAGRGGRASAGPSVPRSCGG